MSEMAYVPLIAFFAAVAWMIWRGFSAKQKYLRRKAAMEQEKSNLQTLLEIPDVRPMNESSRQQVK